MWLVLATQRIVERYWKERLTLSDPLFNVREILKQMILLEDHLLHPDKLCPDCIHKHLLTIEALGDEGVTLDEPNGPFTALLTGVSESARQWMESFHNQDCSPATLAQDVRKFRKLLAPVACDPRESAQRVASRYLSN